MQDNTCTACNRVDYTIAPVERALESESQIKFNNFCVRENVVILHAYASAEQAHVYCKNLNCTDVGW